MIETSDETRDVAPGSHTPDIQPLSSQVPAEPARETARPADLQSLVTQQHKTEEELGRVRRMVEEISLEADKALSLLSATLESTADGIVAWDLDGNITSYNSRFVAIFGFPDELLHRRIGSQLIAYAADLLKNPEDVQRQIQEQLEHPERESVSTFEMKDGRIFERHGFPQRVNGEIVGIVVNMRDVTTQQRTERASAVFAALVASSYDAIVTKTLDGIVTSWNEGAERVFGWSSEEMIGQHILRIIPPERSDEEPRILSRMRRGDTVDHFDTVRLRKDGRRIHVSVTLSPIRDSDGRVIGVSKIARDITLQKQAEAERELLLVREQELRRDAEAADRTKDEFLATLSHELRTPLTAILGWSQMISTNRVSEEDREQGMEIIHRNAALQSQLIDDILDVSRIITGKLRLDVQPVELSSVIEAAVESVLPAATAKGIRLQRVLDAGTGLVSGDPARLQQVIWNLLSNAIKFTPRGGRVQIRLERVNSHVEVVVTDTGTGIEAAMLPHVFERFRQADQSSTRNYGGLGLGLAIVRHIVENHGGTVHAQSPGEDQGSTFTVQLPLLAARPLASHTSPVKDLEHLEERAHMAERTTDARNDYTCPDELNGLDVLVVDDEEDARLLVKAVLQNCHARVRTAGSVNEALEAIEHSPPEVLVSDIGMPGEDGYSLIRRLRALPPEKGGTIPAAALTAYARMEDRLQIMRAGFQIHMPKPVEPAELVAVVANLAHRVRR